MSPSVRHAPAVYIAELVILAGSLMGLGAFAAEYFIRSSGAVIRCPATLEDGRRLLAAYLNAEGSHTRCTYEAPRPIVIEQNTQRKRK